MLVSEDSKYNPCYLVVDQICFWSLTKLADCLQKLRDRREVDGFGGSADSGTVACGENRIRAAGNREERSYSRKGNIWWDELGVFGIVS